MTETDHCPSPETESQDDEFLKGVKEAADRLTKRSEVLQALEDEWVVTAGLVSVYKDLFFDAERLKVLNLVAGPLLRLTQDVLWEHLLLRVARLTDPPVGGREREKESLSVLWLPRLFGGQQKAKLEVQVEEARKAAECARQWRNQRVAHVDLDRVRDDVTYIFRDMRPAVAKPLAPATWEEMDRALQAVHRSLDTAFGYAKMGSIEPAAVTLEIGTKVSERAIQLVEAVQFIDATADPERGSSLGVEEATEFVEKLGPELIEEVRALGPLNSSTASAKARHGRKGAAWGPRALTERLLRLMEEPRGRGLRGLLRELAAGALGSFFFFSGWLLLAGFVFVLAAYVWSGAQTAGEAAQAAGALTGVPADWAAALMLAMGLICVWAVIWVFRLWWSEGWSGRPPLLRKTLENARERRPEAPGD